MLKQRIITAIILSLIVIASIFYLPAAGFRVLALLIASIGFWEFWLLFNTSPVAAGFSLRFFKKHRLKPAATNNIGYQDKINISVVCLLGFILICVFALTFIPANLTLSIGVLWWIIAPYFLWIYSTEAHVHDSSLRALFAKQSRNALESLDCRGAKSASRKTCLRYILGILIFVPFFIGLITLKEEFGPSVLIYFIAIVCSADIGAYFAGRFLGKKLLAAKISPKKTIEGVFGGLLLALVVAKLYNFKPVMLLLVIVICLWSVIGDLFESMLKRIAGVKDSGKILPGHGGVYDRIDSLTAALPIFVLIIQFV